MERGGRLSSLHVYIMGVAKAIEAQKGRIGDDMFRRHASSIYDATNATQRVRDGALYQLEEYGVAGASEARRKASEFEAALSKVHSAMKRMR